MATGKTPFAGSSEDRKETLTCSLCLEIFRDPKLLPCSHTFCLKCLKDLTSRCSSSIFPCPNCRRHITIPSGGVAAFQNNFYLHPEDLEKARDGALCLTHPNQDLDLYCVDCRVLVCLKCILAEHRNHKTVGLAEAAEQASSQLTQDRIRLQKAVSDMIKKIEAVKKDQHTLKDKQAAVESAIVNKHTTLIEAANKFRDQAMASLNASGEEMEKRLSSDLDFKRNTLDWLCRLQDELEQAKSSGERRKLVTIAIEMRTGRGNPKAVNKLCSWEKGETRPSVPGSELILLHFRQFLASVSDVEAGMSAHSSLRDKPPKGKQVSNDEQIPVAMTVEEQFRCGKDADTEVFSLCPVDDNSVWVSYAHHGTNNDLPSEKFDHKGKRLLVHEKMSGKVSFKAVGNGIVRHLIPVAGSPRIYCKSKRKVHYKLNNAVDGKADVTKVEVISGNPFSAKILTEFSIKVANHRAFDVGDREQMFVVVEEPEVPDVHRTVRLYRHSEEDAIDTYKPPTADFQPSDVCFYNLGGQEVLLVSDERNDCIHVVHVQDGTLRFLDYLAPSRLLVLKPTAMNIDFQGCLWVACRDGNIISMTTAS